MAGMLGNTRVAYFTAKRTAFKGIKASGTCKGMGKPDGTAVLECTGKYSLPK